MATTRKQSVTNKNGAVPLTGKSMGVLIAAMTGLLSLTAAVVVPMATANASKIVTDAIEKHEERPRAHPDTTTAEQLREHERRQEKWLDRIDAQLSEIKRDVKALREK